jgi:hypothetical protein
MDPGWRVQQATRLRPTESFDIGGWILGVAGSTKPGNKNDAKRMHILIITFFQVTLWDGSRVEGAAAAGNKKGAKQNAANRKLKAHSIIFGGKCGRQQNVAQMKCLQAQVDANIFKNHPCALMLLEDGSRVWQAVRSQAIRMMPSKCSF